MKEEKSTYDGDGLESFFRNQVQDYHFDFEESDWEKLEERLDQAEVGTGSVWYSWKNLLFIGLFILFGIFIGVFLVEQLEFFPKNTPNESLENKTVIDSVRHATSSKQGFEKSQKTSPKETEEPKISPQAKPEPLPEKPLVSGKQKPSQSLPSSRNHPATFSEYSLSRIKEEEKLGAGRFAPDMPAKQKLENFTAKPLLTDSSLLIGEERKSSVLEANEENKGALSPAGLRISKLAKIEGIAYPSENSHRTEKMLVSSSSLREIPVSKSKVPSTYRRPSPWALALSFAPESSNLEAGLSTSLSNQLGIKIEYTLAPRWRLSSGAYYSLKKYEAPGEYYRPPAGFWGRWTGGNIPENIEALCDVIDIPINISFYLKNTGRNRFYTTAGISSYIMLEEEYHYDYYGSSKPGWISEWNVRNEFQHFLGIGNLSLGYEFGLNSHFSFQVEPYLKIPFTDIGFGRVKLFNSGVFFNLRYQFFKRMEIGRPESLRKR